MRLVYICPEIPKNSGGIEGVEGSECLYTVVVEVRRCSGGEDGWCGVRKRPTVEEAF